MRQNVAAVRLEFAAPPWSSVPSSPRPAPTSPRWWVRSLGAVKQADWITAVEAADFLGCAAPTARQWAKAGHFGPANVRGGPFPNLHERARVIAAGVETGVIDEQWRKSPPHSSGRPPTRPVLDDDGTPPLDVAAVAAMFGVPVKTVRTWITRRNNGAKNGIPAEQIQIGGKRCFSYWRREPLPESGQATGVSTRVPFRPRMRLTRARSVSPPASARQPITEREPSCSATTVVAVRSSCSPRPRSSRRSACVRAGHPAGLGASRALHGVAVLLEHARKRVEHRRACVGVHAGLRSVRPAVLLLAQPGRGPAARRSTRRSHGRIPLRRRRSRGCAPVPGFLTQVVKDRTGRIGR